MERKAAACQCPSAGWLGHPASWIHPQPSCQGFLRAGSGLRRFPTFHVALRPGTHSQAHTRCLPAARTAGPEPECPPRLPPPPHQVPADANSSKATGFLQPSPFSVTRARPAPEWAAPIRVMPGASASGPLRPVLILPRTAGEPPVRGDSGDGLVTGAHRPDGATAECSLGVRAG